MAVTLPSTGLAVVSKDRLSNQTVWAPAPTPLWAGGEASPGDSLELSGPSSVKCGVITQHPLLTGSSYTPGAPQGDSGGAVGAGAGLRVVSPSVF